MLDNELLDPVAPADPLTTKPADLRSVLLRPALIAPVSNDPEIQQILDRAAAGDIKVLPRVQQMLQNQEYIDGLGDVASFALDKLITAAAGDHVAVREGIRAKYEESLAKLLADGGMEPTFAEQIAATRAAHAMLTVDTLEVLANRQAPSSAAAIAFERHLGRAERRLAGALKALAALRRLRKRVVVKKQINVANGPMLVDNRDGGGQEPDGAREDEPSMVTFTSGSSTSTTSVPSGVKTRITAERNLVTPVASVVPRTVSVATSTIAAAAHPRPRERRTAGPSADFTNAGCGTTDGC